MAEHWITDGERAPMPSVNATPPPAPSLTAASTPALDPEIEALLDETWAEYAAAYRYLGSH